MIAAWGRGETFLAGVDFSDGHGGVAERKVGWYRWRASLAIYAQPKWFLISHADYLRTLQPIAARPDSVALGCFSRSFTLSF